MPPFAVTLRVPADNAWAVDAQRTIRAAAATADDPRLLPVADAAAGSGSGELVLRWVELDADAAMHAARIASAAALRALPDLGLVSAMELTVTPQDPDVTRGRPEGR